MNKVTEYIQRLFERYLPSPFTIAVLLTLFTVSIALLFTRPADANIIDYTSVVLSAWEDGIWNTGLLVFAYQMMLILLLGHVLVLTPFFSKLIDRFTATCDTSARAAVIVGCTTMMVAFFNWGLGLIYGALLARKVGERFTKQGKPLNYPLIGAAGYSGLMVWHGGISGSAPIKINEVGHLKSMIGEGGNMASVPDKITFAETIFSGSNLLTFGLLLMVSAALFYYLGSTSKAKQVNVVSRVMTESEERLEGNPLDRSKWLAGILGLLIFTTFIVKYRSEVLSLAITPDMINFLMLGLGIWLHGSIIKFSKAVLIAIEDVAGILIQFPLYFGIMGIMQDTGMVSGISQAFIDISTTTTLPLFTFLSAGIVNVFVPSGGGQWVLQGPIIIESAHSLGVPLPKMIMALAYGDQLTNMLQPFWALPLLSITGLKAKEILPYSLIIMILGGSVYVLSLLLLY